MKRATLWLSFLIVAGSMVSGCEAHAAPPRAQDQSPAVLQAKQVQFHTQAQRDQRTMKQLRDWLGIDACVRDGVIVPFNENGSCPVSQIYPEEPIKTGNQPHLSRFIRESQEKCGRDSCGAPDTPHEAARFEEL